MMVLDRAFMSISAIPVAIPTVTTNPAGNVIIYIVIGSPTDVIKGEHRNSLISGDDLYIGN